MGQRGEYWVFVQAILLAILAFTPVIGPAWRAPWLFSYLGWGCCIAAALLLVGSVVNLGRSLTPFPRPLAKGELVTSGAYRFVRHPIYFGVLLASFGLALLTHSPLRLLMTLVLFVFFDLKARREEVWLEERYPSYLAYKSRVKKLLPWLY
ncbi:MAG: isoprenylcysteine carboxylmethyltransferase family protein [Proteobacteria bacterium]|nr:isoprenylcysteine carboxylmethyltransferase family protein [Pseudomonadota bacterium]